MRRPFQFSLLDAFSNTVSCSCTQLLLIRQLDFGPCHPVKTSGCIKGITRRLFVVHSMMEQNPLQVEPGISFFHFWGWIFLSLNEYGMMIMLE
jgi:hypothetical protein